MAHVNCGSKSDVMANCAMCSLAKILGTNTAMIEKILGADGQSDKALAAAFGHDGLSGPEQHQAVVNSMIRFVEAAFKYNDRTVKGYQFGTWTNMKDNTAIVAYMASKRDGATFAVWGCTKDTIKGYGAHWNFAEKSATGVKFYDFQDQVSSKSKVASSAAFIPPKGERDSAADYNGMIVLSFE